MENISNILKETSKLTATERIHLVNVLLESLDNPNEEIDTLWIIESKVRYEAYKKGEVKSISWEKIKAK